MSPFIFMLSVALILLPGSCFSLFSDLETYNADTTYALGWLAAQVVGESQPGILYLSWPRLSLKLFVHFI